MSAPKGKNLYRPLRHEAPTAGKERGHRKNDGQAQRSFSAKKEQGGETRGRDAKRCSGYWKVSRVLCSRMNMDKKY